LSNLILVSELSLLLLFFARSARQSRQTCHRTLKTEILQPHELAAMTGDSHSTKKGPTTFVHDPEMEGSLNAGDTALAGGGHVLQEEEIKRDLHSRHINMIAIAGMIVRAYFH
jgi:amino acid permease